MDVCLNIVYFFLLIDEGRQTKLTRKALMQCILGAYDRTIYRRAIAGSALTDMVKDDTASTNIQLQILH